MRRQHLSLPDNVEEWNKRVCYGIRANHVKNRVETEPRKDFAAILAGYLALVGPSGDPLPEKLFSAFNVLFFQAKYTKRWYNAAAILPADRDRLLAFSEVVRKYESLAKAGRVKSLAGGNHDIENTVHYILGIGEHGNAFAEAVEASGFTYPGAIFSEQFMRKAARSHRGAFGDFMDEDHQTDLSNIEVIR